VVAYVWLSLAIVCLWVRPRTSTDEALTRFGLSAEWLLLVIVHAYASGIVEVRPDRKWPGVLPYFAWANLLFTCVAEEALVRGVIQRELQGEDTTHILFFTYPALA
jgi:membrane protease YdiL (CAAX protease family)